MHLFGPSWCVAYRNLNSPTPKFRVIKNPFGGYAADPFLVEESGVTYIFAELFDHYKGKAGLGYIVLSENCSRKSNWKMVIEEPYHLSYPHVLKIQGNYFICPESSCTGEVYFYKCIHFPDKWEKMNAFIKDKRCSDTTFFEKNGEIYGVTCLFDENPMQLYLFKYDFIKNEVCFSPNNPIVTGKKLARSGGNFIKNSDKIFRVVQNCSESYGKSLIITQFNLNWPTFNEQIIKEVKVKDIKLNRPMFPLGIHTYNRSENYEVIDLKLKRVNLDARFLKLYKLITSND